MELRMRYGGDAITVGGQARALAFAPGTPHRMVALGNMHTLRVWDLPNTTPVRTIERQGLGSYTALAFPDRDTAILHVGHAWARVNLVTGVIDAIPGAPRADHMEAGLLSPSGKWGLVLR